MGEEDGYSEEEEEEDGMDESDKEDGEGQYHQPIEYELPDDSDQPKIVEKILAHKVANGKTEYYVKWKDLSYLHASWVGPEEFYKERFSKTKLQRYHAKGEVLYEEGEDVFNPLFVEVSFPINLIIIFILLFFYSKNIFQFFNFLSIFFKNFNY